MDLEMNNYNNLGEEGSTARDLDVITQQPLPAGESHAINDVHRPPNFGMDAFPKKPDEFCCECCCCALCSYKGRQSFMELLQCLYHNFCCRLDCATELPLHQAIDRYSEEPVMSPEELIYNLTHESRFLVAVMETLNVQFPEYFFSYLPAGSLREGFGRKTPSTSILATDYDIMLVPDGLRVGHTEVALNTNTIFVFSVIDQTGPDGFVWLKLEDKYLDQWNKYCLKRHIKNEGCSLLSSRLLQNAIKKNVAESQELKWFISRQFTASNYEISAENKGPAFNVQVQRTIKGACGNPSYNQIMVDADFTIALHCSFWPKEAEGFFDENRRKYWPSKEVAKSIKRLGCHVVPKQTSKGLVALVKDQFADTTYGQSTGLEWRYSFSQAEITLSSQIPEVMRRCYLALKAVNKRHFHRKGRKVASYALKCIMFSVVERKPNIYWTNENELMESLFRELLEELKRRLSRKFCANYWIPSINLFVDFTPQDFTLKEAIVNCVLERPSAYVADGYLEYVRCVRLNCCYCGGVGVDYQARAIGEVSPNIDRPTCCCQKNILCTYKQGCCSTCQYDSLSFDVY